MKVDSAAPANEGEVRAWHSIAAGEVLAAFDTTADGLPEDKSTERLERFGPNRLPEPPRRRAIARLASQFHNFLIYVLLAAALLSVALGHTVDAIVILCVVLVNAVFYGLLWRRRGQSPQ